MKPHDKDAKMKYQECNKIVKQKAFERAIAGDEHKRSVVDSLDIESMSESGLGAPLCPSQSILRLCLSPPFPVHAGAQGGWGSVVPLVPVPTRCLLLLRLRFWGLHSPELGLEVPDSGELPCCTTHPALHSCIHPSRASCVWFVRRSSGRSAESVIHSTDGYWAPNRCHCSRHWGHS